VEVGQAGLALDLIDTQTELAESLVLALGVQVTKGDIKNTTTEVVVSVLQTLGAVNEGLAQVADSKAGGSLDVVPVLAGERINNLLLESLLSLGETLVLANSLHKKGRLVLPYGENRRMDRARMEIELALPFSYEP
jgi:hypothetical protein